MHQVSHIITWYFHGTSLDFEGTIRAPQQVHFTLVIATLLVVVFQVAVPIPDPFNNAGAIGYGVDATWIRIHAYEVSISAGKVETIDAGAFTAVPWGSKAPIATVHEAYGLVLWLIFVKRSGSVCQKASRNVQDIQSRTSIWAFRWIFGEEINNGQTPCHWKVIIHPLTTPRRYTFRQFAVIAITVSSLQEQQSML